MEAGTVAISKGQTLADVGNHVGVMEATSAGAVMYRFFYKTLMGQVFFWSAAEAISLEDGEKEGLRFLHCADKRRKRREEQILLTNPFFAVGLL